MVKLWLDVVSLHDLTMVEIIMSGLVITTEGLLAFSGARTHSNNTAGMTAMIETLSFLGPHGPVARDVDLFL